MKKVMPLFACLLAFALFCCKNTEEPETPSPETAVIDTLATEKANPLSGIVYREISEIPQLKEYENQAGSMIHTEKDANGNYKYAISQYGNDKNYLLVFQELVKEADNPKTKYKILDTLNIPKLAIDEHIAACSCRLNKIGDSEIIAIVKSQGSDDIEYYEHIIKAWRANTQTHTIVPIEDVKGIDCANEGYGI
ncbi:hypothetical protein [Flavobacterium nitrogenifigens]|uniref:hypothetical protein n=1 Tax=Flavobacterium nitrogenifigens TaxID=1617283 RepID=UPI0031A26A4B